MKSPFFSLLLFCFFLPFAAVAQQPFVSTWSTVNFGISNANQITIPTSDNPAYAYNYTVDWGDGTIEMNVIGDITHTYANPGIYTVSISGNFPAIDFSKPSDKQKLSLITQWGDIEWATFKNAFSECTLLDVVATDAPNLTNVSDMSGMFKFCGFLVANTANFNAWDVSNVEHMNEMFSGAAFFNQPLNDWNVENVTDMSNMFFSATRFNQPLNDWDVSKVTNMQGMFGATEAFNGAIGDWNVEEVTNMKFMFSGAKAFNQPIGNWNVSKVTSMNRMFGDAEAFNQAIGDWNVSNVENMSTMFSAATAFNQPIGDWNVSNVENMIGMFSGATNFNQPIGTWDVGKTQDLNEMFDNATSFNQDIGNWDVHNVHDMEDMFKNASSFDQDLSQWDVSAVNNAFRMFEGVTLSTPNYDALLIEWNKRTLLKNVRFNGGNSKYCQGEAARNNMITNDNWMIVDGGKITLDVETLDDVTGCKYILPAHTKPDNHYYTETLAGGQMLNPGDEITSSQTIYIYTGTDECFEESSFTVTITTLDVDELPNTRQCGSYTLPQLSPNNNYYTETRAGGQMLNAGDEITEDKTIYIAKEMGDCFGESSFDVFITDAVVVDELSDVTVCESYELPPLTNGDYFSNNNGRGTALFAGDVISTNRRIYIHARSENGECSANHVFSITIDPTGTDCDAPSEDECAVVFPKFITPNGDGVNDFFKVITNKCNVDGEIRIYDRYGQLVFQWSDLSRGWDGYLGNIQLPTSDYWYQFIPEEQETVITGHFTLKR